MGKRLPTVLLRDWEGSRAKIIHIYKDFDIYNGLIKELLLLAKMLDRDKYDFKVCVFGYKGSSFGQQFQDWGGKLDSLNCRWEDNPLIIYKLYKYLKREQPQIVQTYILKPNLYGRIAAFLAGVPIVISTELTLKNQAHSIVSRFRDAFLHPLNAWLNRYTDVILCASDAIRRQWDNKKIAGRIKVVSPYFDPSELRQSERPGTRSGSTEKKDWVIGMVGRLSEEKRHVDVVNAFYEVSKVFPEARLLIVGDGDMKDRLLKVVTRRNLSGRVIFAGFVKDLSEYLSKMDIFVLASRTEGFPIVLLEAMAMGLPVIATRVGGIPELIRDNETGFLVRPFRYKELSRTILGVLSDPKKMHIVGQSGKQYVFSTFSAERFVHERESVYESALTTKGSSQIHGVPVN